MLVASIMMQPSFQASTGAGTGGKGRKGLPKGAEGRVALQRLGEAGAVPVLGLAEEEHSVPPPAPPVDADAAQVEAAAVQFPVHRVEVSHRERTRPGPSWLVVGLADQAEPGVVP